MVTGVPLHEIANNSFVFNGGDSEVAMVREELNKCENREDALKRRLKSVLGCIQTLKQDLEESKEESHALQRALYEAQTAQAEQIANDCTLHEVLSVRMDLGMQIQHLEDALVASHLSQEEQAETIKGLQRALESANDEQTNLSREHRETIGNYKRESEDRLAEAYAVRTAQEQQIQSLQSALDVVRSERDIALQELRQVLAKQAEEQEISAQALQQGENIIQAQAREIDTLKYTVETLKTEQVHREQEFLEVDAKRKILEKLHNELSASHSEDGRLSYQLYVANVALSVEKNALEALQTDMALGKVAQTRMDEELRDATDLQATSKQTVEALQKQLSASHSDKAQLSRDLTAVSHALTKQQTDMQTNILYPKGGFGLGSSRLRGASDTNLAVAQAERDRELTSGEPSVPDMISKFQVQLERSLRAQIMSRKQGKDVTTIDEIPQTQESDTTPEWSMAAEGAGGPSNSSGPVPIASSPLRAAKRALGDPLDMSAQSQIKRFKHDQSVPSCPTCRNKDCECNLRASLDTQLPIANNLGLSQDPHLVPMQLSQAQAPAAAPASVSAKAPVFCTKCNIHLDVSLSQHQKTTHQQSCLVKFPNPDGSLDLRVVQRGSDQYFACIYCKYKSRDSGQMKSCWSSCPDFHRRLDKLAAKPAKFVAPSCFDPSIMVQ
ncbi:hypothetical protein JAAARDRAFT_46456 [Jaapia argillacea MUCL 33604]|uniref:Uncharacterized protein n=1 Tax=Jaapia argillacea MUCL 33604 TaxID=933084 RepID=A0A067PYG4_9AGAM|nr:hypothetical protein JAAARDRAFT_46456 [Jaapia argillacea MUCL 33604]